MAVVELNYLLEITDAWFQDGGRKKENLLLKPITINTNYIAWCRRSEGLCSVHEFTQVHFIDRGQIYDLDIRYEEMRALMQR